MGGSYFNHNGVELFYVVEGEGEPILLLHGWTCDQLDWSFQIPFLTSLGFQTIAIDHRGHGRSQVLTGDDADYSAEALAEDAGALLDHLNIPSALVMGHSLGTIVSSILAVRYPTKVKGLILVDPVYSSSSELLDPFVQWMSAPESPTNAGIFFGLSFYTDSTPAWLPVWHRRRALGNPAHVVSQIIIQAWGKPDSVGRRENAIVFNKKRTCPRFVACAEQEKVDFEREIGVDEATDEVHLIQSGHWLHQQDSETFHATLKAWLSKRGYLPTAKAGE